MASAPLLPVVATDGGATATDLTTTKRTLVTAVTTGSPILHTLMVVNSEPNDANDLVAIHLPPVGFIVNGALAL